ncbi:hypothetical protein C8R46DRAFT_1029365 [Mycena filopes]|nr:hypothetical protein C8R46DRAFT_1029365 [Mycena filopes]
MAIERQRFGMDDIDVVMRAKCPLGGLCEIQWPMAIERTSLSEPRRKQSLSENRRGSPHSTVFLDALERDATRNEPTAGEISSPTTNRVGKEEEESREELGQHSPTNLIWINHGISDRATGSAPLLSGSGGKSHYAPDIRPIPDGPSPCVQLDASWLVVLPRLCFSATTSTRSSLTRMLTDGVDLSVTVHSPPLPLPSFPNN